MTNAKFRTVMDSGGKRQGREQVKGIQTGMRRSSSVNARAPELPRGLMGARYMDGLWQREMNQGFSPI